MPRDVFQLDAQTLSDRFLCVRRRFEAFARPFSAEDLCVQTMPDVSPGKWHLAHVTWFWETFLLKDALPGYAVFDDRFSYLFNSYYETVGQRHARPERGFLTRPSLDDILAYRRHVDEAVLTWLGSASADAVHARLDVILTGLAHEEQHQELFLTDIKHVLSRNSFPEAAFPSRRPENHRREPGDAGLEWVAFEGGLHAFGHEGPGFAFDHEGPLHDAVVKPFALASRPVSNADYLAFMEDGGYRRPEFWLSDGWAAIKGEHRTAPFYWRETGEGWSEYTLHGLEALDPAAPVSHLDFYEADAFAAWSGFRLPEEREWEHAARAYEPMRATWASPDGCLHPVAPREDAPIAGLFGQVWEWTRSSYSPYPGYRAPKGAIGEYNGKFMCGQFVLRGGSCLTSPDHMRATYRNFFPPGARWQMTGLRLARDI